MTIPTRNSETGVFVVATVLTGMLGVVDCLSGYELQFFVFYFVPIWLASWHGGLSRGCLVAGLSAAVWFTSDLVSGHPYSHMGYEFWNTGIRLIAFLGLAWGVAQVRRLLARERQLVDDLEKSLAQIRTLRGLLPICSYCKKIRNDQGYWLQLEQYIMENSNAQFTHGICVDCANRLLVEAGLPRLNEKFGSTAHSDDR